MKPAPFEYSRPADIDEACTMLAADDGARLIAGGQTMVPLMAMRLARPTRLVDIARIPGLSFIREQGASVVVGAATRQHVIETDPVIRNKLPLLAKVMPYVGHSATRARGTVGGSIANGDAAAEIVLVAVTLEATLTWRENGADHEIPAAEFFLGPMVTSLPLAACLKSVSFPVWHETRVGVSFHEVNATIGLGAATAVPMRLDAVADSLTGHAFDEVKVRDAAKAALADVEMLADLHASADYRRRVGVTMVVRAVADAYESAAGRT
jgi:CO/xanthine dehydrogenase FAD-binding subunit